MSTISKGESTVTTSSLSLTNEGDVDSGPASGVCCTNCNIYTGDCQECHTCAEEI